MPVRPPGYPTEDASDGLGLLIASWACFFLRSRPVQPLPRRHDLSADWTAADGGRGLARRRKSRLLSQGVAFRPDLTTVDITRAIERIQATIKQAFPTIKHAGLHAARGPDLNRARWPGRAEFAGQYNWQLVWNFPAKNPARP